MTLEAPIKAIYLIVYKDRPADQLLLDQGALIHVPDDTIFIGIAR